MKRFFVKYIKNKFVLAAGVFLLWICFFNDIDLIYIIQSKREASALRSEVNELKDKNAKAIEALADLSKNQRSMEKFARETYYMKRDNEDVYVFKERAD